MARTPKENVLPEGSLTIQNVSDDGRTMLLELRLPGAGHPSIGDSPQRWAARGFTSSNGKAWVTAWADPHPGFECLTIGFRPGTPRVERMGKVEARALLKVASQGIDLPETLLHRARVALGISDPTAEAVARAYDAETQTLTVSREDAEDLLTQ